MVIENLADRQVTAPQQAIKQNMNVLKLTLSLFAIGFALYSVIKKLLQNGIVEIDQLPYILLSVPVILVLIGFILFSMNVTSFEKHLLEYEI